MAITITGRTIIGKGVSESSGLGNTCLGSGMMAMLVEDSGGTMGTRLISELDCTLERTLGLGGILVCTHGLEVNLEVTHRYEWALRLIQELEWAPM